MVALEVRETKRWQWGVRNIYVGGARSRVRWRAGETGGEDHEVLVKHGCCDAPFQLPSVVVEMVEESRLICLVLNSDLATSRLTELRL